MYLTFAAELRVRVHTVCILCARRCVGCKYYTEMVDATRRALAAAGPRARLRGMIWVQVGRGRGMMHLLMGRGTGG